MQVVFQPTPARGRVTLWIGAVQAPCFNPRPRAGE